MADYKDYYDFSDTPRTRSTGEEERLRNKVKELELRLRIIDLEADLEDARNRLAKMQGKGG